MKLDDLTARTFGRLTAVEIAGKNSRGNILWKCICTCGLNVVVLGSNLRSGRTTSCGCKQKEIKHGHCVGGVTPEYTSWCKMRRRCTDKKSKQWKDYGGRGITVCDRWQSFDNFISDMGCMPAPGYTLERKDNNKGYSPDNCVWATKKQQGRNRRDNHVLTYNGKTATIMEWSEITGLRFGTIWDRINRGWSVEDALTLPSNRSHRRA